MLLQTACPGGRATSSEQRSAPKAPRLPELGRLAARGGKTSRRPCRWAVGEGLVVAQLLLLLRVVVEWLQREWHSPVAFLSQKN